MAPLRTIACVLGMAALTLPAAAADAPVMIPGGQMDTSIPGIDVYVGKPKAADPGSNPACIHAKAYFDMEDQGRYAELSTLFADDAVFLDPLRKSLTGRLNIGDFYKNHVSKINPSIIPVTYAAQGMSCFVETTMQRQINGQPRWVFSAIDHFTVNSAGKFSRFIVFLRPPPVDTTSSPGAVK